MILIEGIIWLNTRILLDNQYITQHSQNILFPYLVCKNTVRI